MNISKKNPVLSDFLETIDWFFLLAFDPTKIRWVFYFEMELIQV